jgi:5'-nucleotidase
MYKILISNDGGMRGPGLRPLMRELSKIAKVYIIVPKGQMSGAGHGISLAKYKKVEKVEKDFYIIKSGTPADCVKYGLYFLFKNEIDLVVSGINTCPNLGQDVIFRYCRGCKRRCHERSFVNSCFCCRNVRKGIQPLCTSYERTS